LDTDEAAGLEVSAAAEGRESTDWQRQLHVCRVQSTWSDQRHCRIACHLYVYSFLCVVMFNAV